jgi:hypothetical protein
MILGEIPSYPVAFLIRTTLVVSVLFRSRLAFLLVSKARTKKEKRNLLMYLFSWKGGIYR